MAYSTRVGRMDHLRVFETSLATNQIGMAILWIIGSISSYLEARDEFVLMNGNGFPKRRFIEMQTGFQKFNMSNNEVAYQVWADADLQKE